MSDSNTHLKRMAVYLDGRKGFEDNQPRDSNPHIRSNAEFALHWWNGWDAAKKESLADHFGKRKS